MTTDIEITTSPLESPEEWDYVIIENVSLPCLDKLPECSVGRKVTAKGKAGSDDVRITDKGQDVNEVKITLVFWLDEHFTKWNSIKDLISARRRLSDRRPLNVSHPVLSQIGITAIYAKRLHGLKFVSVGRYEVTIDAYEYRDSQSGRRNTTQRAQRTTDFVRETAFTSTIRESTARSVANFQASRPSQNGASNP